MTSTVFKAGNANSGSWKNKQPRFNFVPKAIEDVDAWATDVMNERMTSAQEGVLGNYAMDAYEPINNFLRHGSTDARPMLYSEGMSNADAQKKVAAMQSASQILPFDVEVWRGVNWTPTNTFSDKGFVSTSWKKSIATTFAMPMEGPQTGKPDTYIHMIVPKGFRAIPWNRRGEHELILLPNTKFKIVKENKEQKPADRNHLEPYTEIVYDAVIVK